MLTLVAICLSPAEHASVSLMCRANDVMRAWTGHPMFADVMIDKLALAFGVTVALTELLATG